MYTMYGVIERELRNLPRGNLIPIKYHDLDDALGAARNLNSRGGSALLIKGDDGTHLTKYEIVEVVRERGTELNGRPKVY